MQNSHSSKCGISLLEHYWLGSVSPSQSHLRTLAGDGVRMCLGRDDWEASTTVVVFDDSFPWLRQTLPHHSCCVVHFLALGWDELFALPNAPFYSEFLLLVCKALTIRITQIRSHITHSPKVDLWDIFIKKLSAVILLPKVCLINVVERERKACPRVLE